jgi:hypothetical protein
MGWDAGLHRRLAVPFAIKDLGIENENCMRIRKLRDSECEDIDMLRQMADNRTRIERLWKDVCENPEVEGGAEIESELDYIHASIGLGLLEITGELEDVPCSEELLLEEATA